ncbi:MAG: oligosaccharide flippase family protein [Candidatus Enteromonas sp.]|nr:oligosaccharide flippase family protein [Candidatus Enteromonas sp.]
MASASPVHSNIRSSVVISLVRTLTMTLLSFLTFPYVTRALGDQAFGLYTWANTFVYYFLVLAKISIPNIAIRECSKVKNDKEKLSHLAQEFFLIQGIFTLFSFAFMALLVCTVPSLLENSGLIFLLSINFLMGLFSFEWIYIVLEKHFYITARSIFFIAVGAALTFLFIKVKTGYVDDNGTYVNPALNEIHIYGLITISTTILTVVSNLIFLPRYISLKKTAPYHFRAHAPTILVLFLASIALTVYNQTDEFLLGFIDSSKAAVGAYSVGVKGIDIIITLITSLYAVFMPRASYYYGKEDKRFFQNLVSYSLNITFFIAVPAIATMASLSTPITALFSGSEVSAQYQDSSAILASLSLMMLTYSIGDNIYTEILIPSKREKYYLFGMLGGILFNVGLSFLFALVLFPLRPGLGVAIATTITDVMLVSYFIAVSWKYSRKAIFNRNNLKICLAGILIGGLTFFLLPFIESLLPYSGSELWVNYLLSSLILLVLDAVIYLGFLALTKEKIVSSFLRKKGGEHGEPEPEGK